MAEFSRAERTEFPLSWSLGQELDSYATLVLIRRFEERLAQLFAMGDLTELDPLAIGQEAVAAGIAEAAGADDVIVLPPRSHGLMLARGVPPETLMWHLAAPIRPVPEQGRRTLDQQLDGVRLRRRLERDSLGAVRNILSAASPPGALIWCMVSDESPTERLGDIELARAAGIPMLVIIEASSAKFAPGGVLQAGQPSRLAVAIEAAGLSTAAAGGLDARTVEVDVRSALARAKQESSVEVLEIVTYRYQGHGVGSRGTSQAPPRHETDPVAKARARILRAFGQAAEERLKHIEHRTRATVSAAVADARKSSRPV